MLKKRIKWETYKIMKFPDINNTIYLYCNGEKVYGKVIFLSHRNKDNTVLLGIEPFKKKCN